VIRSRVDEWFGMQSLRFSSTYSCSDAPLTYPYEREAYYLPPPYPEFNMGFVRQEVYSLADGSFCSKAALQYTTP